MIGLLHGINFKAKKGSTIDIDYRESYQQTKDYRERYQQTKLSQLYVQLN